MIGLARGAGTTMLPIPLTSTLRDYQAESADATASRSPHSRARGVLRRPGRKAFPAILRLPGARRMNLIELNRALRQLRLGRHRRRTRNPSPPGASRSHAPDGLPLLLNRRRTHSSRRSPAGAQDQAGRVPRPSEEPR